MECSELGINIATRAQVGGGEGDDRIEWVITSINFYEWILPDFVTDYENGNVE